MNDFLIGLGIFLGIIIIFYFIARLWVGTRLIQSSFVINKDDSGKAELVGAETKNVSNCGSDNETHNVSKIDKEVLEKNSSEASELSADDNRSQAEKGSKALITSAPGEGGTNKEAKQKKFKKDRTKKTSKNTTADLLDDLEADQFYYLPSYEITLNLTATIKVTRVSNEKASYIFQTAAIDVQTQIKPDTNNLIKIKYCRNWFSSDDLLITTSSDSLLQSISATSEDRIENIITQITQAPEQFIDSLKPALRTIKKDENEEQVVYEIHEINKSFIKGAEEIANGSFEIKCNIPLEKIEGFDNTDLQISLVFKNDRIKKLPSKVYNGIFTRVMANQTWHFEDNNKKFSISFTCFGPDSSRIIKVPIRSSFFIKKIQMPKFSNGILTENHIVKPSEIEGFASIPINILKAIFSIPSQLLSFKITHIQQETGLITAEKNLNSSKESLPKASENTNTVGQLNSSNAIPQANVPLLGKLPPSLTNTPDLDIINRRFAAVNINIEDIFDNPPLPSFSRIDNKGIIWESYGNDTQLPICVPAAAANLIKCWTANTQPIKNPNPNDVYNLYSKNLKEIIVDGKAQKGCNTRDVLEYWRQNGFGSDKIATYNFMKPINKISLQMAIYYYGGCIIGLQMPLSAVNKNVWEFSNVAAENVVGSWGGHAVAAFGYSDTHIQVISWGRLILMSWKFFETYNDEVYVVLSEDDWSRNNVTPVGGLYTYNILESDIRNFNQA